MKIVIIRFVDADANAVLIEDAEFFGNRHEDAAFRRRRRRSTGVNETNKSIKKIDADAASGSCVNQTNSTYYVPKLGKKHICIKHITLAP